MANKKFRLDDENGAIGKQNSSGITVEESTNNWDTETERAKQELAYYDGLESKLISQMVKETNAVLAMLRTKNGRLCQLDRQWLKAKLALLNSKLEASVMAEQQTIKIKSAVRHRSGIRL